MKKKNIIQASFVFIGLVLLVSFISNDQTGVTIVNKPNKYPTGKLISTAFVAYYL